MADLVIGISVEGAKEATAEITGVKTALGGVETSLDNTTAASGRLGAATETVSGTQAEVAEAFRGTTTETAAATREGAAATSQANVMSSGQQVLHDKIYGTTTATKESTGAMAALNNALREGGPIMTLVGAAAEGVGYAIGVTLKAGAQAAAATVAALIQENVKLIQAQADVQAAVDAQDFKKLSSGLTSVTDEMRAGQIAWDTFTKGLLEVGPFQTLGAEFVILKDMFSGTSERAKLLAQGMLDTWESFGRGKATLDVTRASLEAQKAAIGNVIAMAPSIDALTEAYNKQVQVQRGLTQVTIDLAANEAKRVRDNELGQAKVLIDEGNVTEGRARAANAYEQYGKQMQAVAFMTQQADAAATAQQLANAQKVGEARAKEIETQGKITDLYFATGEEATKAGQAEVDARYKAAQANAQFYGQAQTGVAQYYDGLTRTITEVADYEILRIQARHDADVGALKARRDALPAYSVAWQQLDDQIRVKDAETQLAIQSKADETTTKVLQNETAKAAAVRAAYADMIAKSEAHYAALAAMGQGDVQEHLRQLQALANDDNLSYGQRQQYAVTAYQGYQQLDQQIFDRKKALGQTTQVDEVNRLADLTARTAEGSTARIQAETAWANAATKLRQDAANAGMAGINAIRKALEDEGYSEVTLGDIVQNFARIRAESIQDVNRGLGATVDQLNRAIMVGGAFNELNRAGITIQQGVGAALDQTRGNLEGLRGPFDAAGQSFTNLGQTAVSLDPRLDAIDLDFQLLGISIVDSLQTAYNQGLASTEKFFTDLEELITAGVSRTADRIYQGLIDRLKQAIDAEALAS